MRFVFAKSRLRTRYKSLFLVFSGKLHDAIMSGQVSLTVENVFMENNIFRECVFGRWRWEWCFWKSFGICFASHDVFARQQQLPNCTLFQQVLHVNVLNMVEMVFVENVYFWTGVVLQNTGKMHLQHMQMHVEVEEFIFVLLQLEFGIWYSGSEVHAACAQWFKHVARQNKRETKTTLHSGRQSQDKLPLLVLCVARKRWERGQVRICGFLTCVCLQVYSSASPLRLGPQRVGLAFASDAASGCKPEFSHGSGASAHA